MSMRLLTIDDIAAFFRVERRTVAEKWIHRPGFPTPRYAPTRANRLWDADEVERWATPAERQSSPQTPGSR